LGDIFFGPPLRTKDVDLLYAEDWEIKMEELFDGDDAGPEHDEQDQIFVSSVSIFEHIHPRLQNRQRTRAPAQGSINFDINKKNVHNGNNCLI